VLELGCGNGRITLNLAKRGFNACGVDISGLYISEAREKAKKMRVRANLQQGDTRKISSIVAGKFDAVISIWTSIGFYNKRTDESVFRQVAKLLKKKGLFLILQTMSRERLLSFFHPHMYDEDEQYIRLDHNDFDKKRSVIHNKWVFYKKIKKDLKYIDEIAFSLRIYSLPEIVDMAEKCGLSLVGAYDLITTMQPFQNNSPINVVFQKK
jgi:SAM-dependent methyltransferase